MKLPPKNQRRTIWTTPEVTFSIPCSGVALELTSHCTLHLMLVGPAGGPGEAGWRLTGLTQNPILLYFRDGLYIPSQGTSSRPVFAYRVDDTWFAVTGCFHGSRRYMLRLVRRRIRFGSARDRRQGRIQLAMIETIDRALLET